MMKQSVLVFLYRCIQNISTLVMFLSVASLLPSTVILSLTLGGNLSPAIITLLTIAISFMLTLFPTSYQHPSSSFWVRTLQKMSLIIKNSVFSDFYFGICKGLQTMTVLSYFRASLSLQQTYRTPMIAGFVAALSIVASFCEKHTTSPRAPHLITSTVDFVLNALTAGGFLYLLNTFHALPVGLLCVCTLSLVALSVSVESNSILNTTPLHVKVKNQSPIKLPLLKKYKKTGSPSKLVKPRKLFDDPKSPLTARQLRPTALQDWRACMVYLGSLFAEKADPSMGNTPDSRA